MYSHGARTAESSKRISSYFGLAEWLFRRMSLDDESPTAVFSSEGRWGGSIGDEDPLRETGFEMVVICDLVWLDLLRNNLVSLRAEGILMM